MERAYNLWLFHILGTVPASLDDNLNFIFGQAEQPGGLDQFQALVHQGGGVDGDLGTHVPVGVLEGISLGLAPQLLSLHAEEGAAGGREQDLGQALGALLVLQALEDGGVLAVHRQQLHPVLFHSLRDQMTAGGLPLNNLLLSEGTQSASWSRRPHR